MQHHKRTVYFCAQCGEETSHEVKKLPPNDEMVDECQACGTLKVEYYDI
jgi:uncharacterized Zn finger protein